MSNSRPGLKVSGLISSGKIFAKEGVKVSHAFDAPPSSPDSVTREEMPPRLSPNVADSGAPIQWELVTDELHYIGVDLVVDSPFQTEEDAKGRYDAESIDELAHTMAKTGQQEPIVVRWMNGRFELIAGHRRIRAARSMGWTEILARIVKLDDAAAEKGLMVHNEGRKENSDYAKAKLYARAKEKGYARTQDDLAHMFATKQSSVSKRLAMLTLPPPILKMLDAKPDLITMGTAKTIHELVEELPGEIDLVVKAVERIKEQDAPEKSVRGWVAQMVHARTKGQEKARTDNGKPKVITDPANRQLYTAKLEGRVITLRVSALELDPVEELAQMVEYFQSKANAKASTAAMDDE
ncbi:ParB/RepB/Spo0J family partition protein [Massilia genomosp. 1]|uniref:ParB/RepB/Spo0J family partition protein n=1 Tax=Massilia genomosp. 1 TaxID=2609280 RepID=A0ABX0N4I6_9BURK|nr:ParB/RepB/Spo0J family partition protein [Massilia genomosp. 1]NHZ66454.1 ParB/RepB/Spo0J family partition protein [Massilia genomosp. 1]